ncbi:MAG TPA: NAD(P)-dependent oxidoreductase [Candidatus Acidoferrales bacterium]|nr:NAD(P)-dependent oxidoreductase [Candidatus Acidoferrales bacterium]
MDALPSLGFLGLGAMGEPMVRSLRKAGYPVTVAAHRSRASLERLVAEGAQEAASPEAVGAASAIVITCVPDAPQVEEVLFGDRGAAKGLRSGSVVIDMSTISPIASQRFAERLAAGGVDFVDAPVSGGPARAATGTLTIMVGAKPAVFERVEPVLKAMGTPTLLGGIGMGETVKLVNQVIIASVMIANAEALVFAKRAGADLDAVRKVIATATGSNYLLDQWLPKTWLSGTFKGGFAMDLLRKDVAAALDAARANKHAMPLTGLAYQLYTAQSAGGDGALDYSAIAKAYERIAGD